MTKKNMTKKKRKVKAKAAEAVISQPIIVQQPQPQIRPDIRQEKDRFKDLLPISLSNNDNISDTAKVMVERGEDERLKTEIYTPMELSVAKTVSKMLYNKGLTKSADVINTIIEQYSSFMFSYKRHSRQEYIQTVEAFALKKLAEQQQDLLQKLTTSPEVKK